MTKKILFLLLVSGWCGQGWAHEAPVPVNTMRWVVDAGLLRVYFRADAPWWGLNVFGTEFSLPPVWSADMQKAAKHYFDQHFILQADGHVVPSKLVAYHYKEEAWQYYGGTHLELDFFYALPASAQTLSGQATFYKEEKEDPHETHLTIDGAPTQAMVLTLDHPQFSFALKDILRSPAQRWHDAWLEGLQFWKTAPWFLFAFGAFHLQWRSRTKRTGHYIGLLAAAALSAAFLSYYAGFNSGYGVGAFVCLLGVNAVVDLALNLYHRRLRIVSESQADTLFVSQIRFVSLLLAGVTLLLMAPSFQKPT